MTRGSTAIALILTVQLMSPPTLLAAEAPGAPGTPSQDRDGAVPERPENRPIESARLQEAAALAASAPRPAPPEGAPPQPAAPAAVSQAPNHAARPDYTRGAVWWPNFTRVYKRPYVADVNLSNSVRLDQLLRDGNLYLSLEDAIALALENNLDIAYMRYEPLIADTDILRSRAGGSVRAMGAQVSSQSTGGSAGGGGGGGINIPQVSVGAAGGPPIPQLEPVLTGTSSWAHRSNPTTSNFTTGTNTFISEGANNGITYSQAFLTGTAFSLSFNTSNTSNNSLRNNFNPSTTSSARLDFRQSLTQGFGRSVNSRNIRIARNNREVSDLAFKQQVIQTVSQIQNLYWDLVSYNEDVRVKQQSLQLSEKLYNDNKRQVEIGTLAPIEIVRAEAEVAARQQELTASLTLVQQQETLIKNAISKSGVADVRISDVRIIPTTRITVPTVEPIEPVQDLISMALQSRPELAQSRIRLTNADISIKAVRQAMLPQVDFVAYMTNNALAGSLNPNVLPIPGQPVAVPSEFFLGGVGTTLSQIFARNFPDYSVGVNLTIPIRNRAAQADMVAAELQHRQQEIRMQQAENSVRVDVRNSLIALQQARARVDSAIKSRVLQEQTLDAEQKKYALGASTIFLVIQAQRDLALARSVEVAAMNNYTKARVELDRATGQTLAKNNISLDEAYEGTVKRPPDPIPQRAPGD
jgi:outer membrane protein TolC